MNHGLQHLRGCDHTGSHKTALVDQILLNSRNLHARDFHSQVSSCNHDSIGNLADFFHVIYTGTILNFRNDVDILSAVGI